MDTNVMIAIANRLGTNVKKDGYECYNEFWIWYRLDMIFVLIWIRMSWWIMNLIRVGFYFCSNLDTNVKGWLRMLI